MSTQINLVALMQSSLTLASGHRAAHLGTSRRISESPVAACSHRSTGRVYEDASDRWCGTLSRTSLSKADKVLVHFRSRATVLPMRAVMVQNTCLQARTVASAVSSRFVCKT